MYFLVKCETTQGKPKVFEKTVGKTQGPQDKTQEPRIRSKNPRSWEKTQGVATLTILSVLSSTTFDVTWRR